MNADLSPRIVCHIRDDLFGVGRDGCGKFDGVAVRLLEWDGTGGDVPGVPAIEVLYHLHLDRLFLMIADLDFE